MTTIIRQEKNGKALITLKAVGSVYTAEKATEAGSADHYRTEKEYRSTDRKKAMAAYNRYRREA